MGSVRVEMHIKQRTVQARVVAETEAASKALREHLPDLRARLESLGMQVEKIEIETETNDPHQGSHFDAESQQQQQSRGERDSSTRASRPQTGRPAPVSPQVPQTTAASPVVAATGGVDIRL
jgi:flagellar hook-length control protein FliK